MMRVSKGDLFKIKLYLDNQVIVNKRTHRKGLKKILEEINLKLF